MLSFIICIFLALYAFKKWKYGDKVTFYVVLLFLIDKCYYLTLFNSHTRGLRCDDIALLMIFATAFLTMQSKGVFRNNISNWSKSFLVFIAISSLVSVIFWQIPVVQVFKGARGYLFITALYDIMTLEADETKELIKKIFLLNVIFSGIYIFHSLFPSLHILYDSDYKVGFLGLPRFWCPPPLIVFACLYSVFLYEKNTLKEKIIAFIPFAALILTQSRGKIISTAFIIMLGFFFFNASTSSKIIQILFGILVAIFVNTTILSGETGEKTANDLSLITSGQIETISDRNEIEGEATLAYRYWRLLTNIRAINEGNIVNKIFGLGFFVDIDTEKANELGIADICQYRMEDGKRLLFTPDIAYANVFAYLGYVGIFLYYGFFFVLFKFFKGYNTNSTYAQQGILYLIFILLSGLNSSFGTYTTCLIMPLLFVQAIETNNE